MDRDKRSNPDVNTVIVVHGDDDRSARYISLNIYEIDGFIQQTAGTIKVITNVIKSNIVNAEDGKVKKLTDFEIISLLDCMDLLVAKLHDQSLNIQNSLAANLQ